MPVVSCQDFHPDVDVGSCYQRRVNLSAARDQDKVRQAVLAFTEEDEAGQELRKQLWKAAGLLLDGVAVSARDHKKRVKESKRPPNPKTSLRHLLVTEVLEGCIAVGTFSYNTGSPASVVVDVFKRKEVQAKMVSAIPGLILSDNMRVDKSGRLRLTIPFAGPCAPYLKSFLGLPSKHHLERHGMYVPGCRRRSEVIIRTTNPHLTPERTAAYFSHRSRIGRPITVEAATGAPLFQSVPPKFSLCVTGPPQQHSLEPFAKRPAWAFADRQVGHAVSPSTPIVSTPVLVQPSPPSARVRWSADEDQALVEGLQRYGHDSSNRFANVLAHENGASGKKRFNPKRTSVALKDRFRTLRKSGMIQLKPAV